MGLSSSRSNLVRGREALPEGRLPHPSPPLYPAAMQGMNPHQAKSASYASQMGGMRMPGGIFQGSMPDMGQRERNGGGFGGALAQIAMNGQDRRQLPLGMTPETWQAQMDARLMRRTQEDQRLPDVAGLTGPKPFMGYPGSPRIR